MHAFHDIVARFVGVRLGKRGEEPLYAVAEAGLQRDTAGNFGVSSQRPAWTSRDAELINHSLFQTEMVPRVGLSQ